MLHNLHFYILINKLFLYFEAFKTRYMFSISVLTWKLIKYNGCLGYDTVLSFWAMINHKVTFFCRCLAISIPDEVSAHKTYQPEKRKISVLFIVEIIRWMGIPPGQKRLLYKVAVRNFSAAVQFPLNELFFVARFFFSHLPFFVFFHHPPPPSITFLMVRPALNYGCSWRENRAKKFAFQTVFHIRAFCIC